MLTLQQIFDDIDFLVGTDEESYPVADKVRNINIRYSEAVSLILQSDGRWQWDDNNATDRPTGINDLVDGQQDYEINGLDFLTVSLVLVKDKQGNYQALDPVSYHDSPQKMTDLESEKGMPRFYSKRGNSILLLPKPDSSDTTLTEGIKVMFQRPPEYFEAGDTETYPGFNPLCHRYLSVGSALDYAESNTMERKITTLSNKLQRETQNVSITYAQRSRDESPKVKVSREDYGASAML